MAVPIAMAMTSAVLVNTALALAHASGSACDDAYDKAVSKAMSTAVTNAMATAGSTAARLLDMRQVLERPQRRRESASALGRSETR